MEVDNVAVIVGVSIGAGAGAGTYQITKYY
jgi:hypothetical protein